MERTADVAPAPPVRERASDAKGWPHPPLAPKSKWMAWVPQAAVIWALVYGLVRVWWAIHGAPGSGPMLLDLMYFSGWSAVGLCAAAALVVVALRISPWRWPLLAIAS